MNIQKYTPPKIEFCTDYGEQPLLLAHVTKDRSMIAVLSLLGGFVAMAAVGFPGALLVGFAALNDISYAAKVDSLDDTPEAAKDDQGAIDVTATTVENDQGATQSPTPIAAAPSFTSPNLTPPKTRSELIARLKQDCPLLLKLVKSHPIRAVGVQRSGKTTLVKRLTLLRMALMENHRVVASSPHYEAANQYPDVFDVVGLRNGKRDYPAIERAWYQMAGDVEACNMANITYVWDEFSLQDKAIPITPENDPIKTVLTSCLRETMKFQIYPIFILHGETAAFLPGSKGLVTVILASTVRVETIGEAVEGDDGLEMIRPTGRFNVTWLDGSKGEGILPAWLSEDFLLEMIGPRSIPVVKTSTATIETPSATIAHLENAYQAAAVEVEVMTQCDQKPDGLNEFQLVETIWDYLDGKGSRNIKQITDAMRAKGKISEPDLRERFGEFDTYKSAINQVVLFGVAKGFLVEVFEDAFETARKH